MAESQDPRPARPKVPPPGSPLPRLWKAAPEPEPDAPRKKKKKKGAGDGAADEATARKGKKGKKTEKEKPANSVLIEETPELDTYETRQKIRIAVGAVGFGIVCLVGFILYRVLSPSTGGEAGVTPPDGFAMPGNPADKGRVEAEARSLFERARTVAQNGNGELALALLKRCKATYPGTIAAREAQEALDRPKQNLPLFLDTAAVVATAAEHRPTAPEPPKVVVARAPDAPRAATAEVQLVLPANPAEPVGPGGPPGGSQATAPPPSATQTAMIAGNTAQAQATAVPVKPLPEGFRARAGTNVHASGWPVEIVGDRDGAPMVLVPGGSFSMGRDDGEPAEAPAHPVKVSTFYIDKHEVTNRQYALFLKEMDRKDTERQRALARGTPGACDSDDCPAVMVDAPDARDYCKWAGKLLPTEAQWEYAARGNDGRLHPWGQSPPAWDRKREPRQIDPIMSFPVDVSPFGVHDLAGNAMEWTKDWFDAHYYRHFRGATASDPTGPSRPRSSLLTVKGGAKNWSATRREGIKLDSRLPFLGFRGVLQADAPQAAPEPAAQPGFPGTPAAGGVPF